MCLVVEEKQVEIENDVFINAMTFNGTTPEPLIIVHEGDYAEVTLENPAFNAHFLISTFMQQPKPWEADPFQRSNQASLYTTMHRVEC